ncbi:FAS1 domain-containing protein [Xylaria intraflava]|nr:FAS1 domain-containing protein [Xylaria intraflava]
MHTQYLALLAIFGTPALSQSLLSVLQERGFTEFAKRLEGSPLLSAGPDVIVYAPTDASLAVSGNITITRRNDGEENDPLPGLHCNNKASPSFIDPDPEDDGDGDDKGSNSTESRKFRLVKNQAVSPARIYGSWLNDPAFVNLGPGHNQTVVEKSVSSEPQPRIFTGLGASAKIMGSDIPFDNGVVRPIDGYFTLPANVSYSLPSIGADKFGAAIEKVGLGPYLDVTTAITVLAPSNDALKNIDALSSTQILQLVRDHVVAGFPAYTPLLKNGQVFRTLGGSRLVVSIRGGVPYVNGARIVAGDAITKNGVIHTIDQVLTASPSVPVGAATTVGVPSWKALALTVVGFTTIVFFSA